MRTKPKSIAPTLLLAMMAGPLLAASGDYDGDGRSDVLWRNFSTGANVIWRSGKASTPQAVAKVINQSWQIAGKGDFDGDGKADVFWRNFSDGANVIWRSGNAATLQAVAGVTNQNWQVAGVGDFNGDGRSDVFWRNAITGANTIWKSANASTRQVMATVFLDIAGVGDFDGDGRSDVFWRNGDGSCVIWKSGNATTAQAVGFPPTATGGWKVVGVGDFDGDGKSDVFWRNVDRFTNIQNGANVIWKSGNASTPQAVVSVTNLNWYVDDVGDFDGDGKADVFWRNSGSGAVGTGANVIWKSGNAYTPQATAAVTNLAWVVVPYEGQEFSPWDY
ncbi:MAG: FG-GAP repeat domain-containing protein [Luteimonas sp.]